MIDMIFTIGAYGHSAASFFEGLHANDVDVLVDIRQRRGMRGRPLAFLNATALQRELVTKGIAYMHLKELAPTAEVRTTQKAVDSSVGIPKAQRLELSTEFKIEYERQVLSSLSADEIVNSIHPHRRPCFFCVEGPPRACHRSLVSDWIQVHTGTPVSHIGRVK